MATTAFLPPLTVRWVINFVLLDLVQESAMGNLKELCGMGPIPIRLLQGSLDQFFLDDPGSFLDTQLFRVEDSTDSVLGVSDPFRKVICRDLGPITQNDGPLDRIFQLTHISRPGVALHKFGGVS